MTSPTEKTLKEFVEGTKNLTLTWSKLNKSSRKFTGGIKGTPDNINAIIKAERFNRISKISETEAVIEVRFSRLGFKG